MPSPSDTVCSRGHVLADVGTFPQPNRPSVRCRACHNDSIRRSQERRRERTATVTGLRTARERERFWAKASESDSGCWLWSGAVNNLGYGCFQVAAKSFLAHRLAYQELVGDVPEGLELDHLCRTRNCINPWHLEPVTHAVNVLRAHAA